MRIEQPDGDDSHADIADIHDASANSAAPGASDVPDASGASEVPDTADVSDATDAPRTGNAAESASPRDGPAAADTADMAEGRSRTARVLDYRAVVDATYRAHAIDQAYEKIHEIERNTVTPAMKRIEAEDPDRHLAGLEFRLKGRDRLAEKAESHLQSNAELSPEQAVAKVKDAIRYTFVYRDDHYTEGVQADTRRLAGCFELVDLRNSWPAAEYKGINTRWRVPEGSQVFEVQFHTNASFEAKQSTHGAYEKIRDPATSKRERDKLQGFQRQVSADIPVPRDVSSIKDHP